MGLADDVAADQAAQTQTKLERQVGEARRDAQGARAALKATTAELEAVNARLGLLEGVESLDPHPPAWMSPKTRKAGHRATVTTILSDLHLDEVVDPSEMQGANAYNRDIATLRLRRYFDKVIELSRDYLAGVTYDGAVCMLGGDIFSGDIHEELTQTNEGTILESLLYWSELLAAGIDQLAGEFGKVHVPVVVGNHGRRTRKPRAKLRAKDNFDWLLGHLLARHFAGDKRVTFQIPDSADCRFEVYGTRYLLTHGDQFRGGGGIAGIWSPIVRGHTKKHQREAQLGHPYDVMIMGHWHQLVWGGSFIINGSSKGYDEYAALSNFGFEPPQQALWLTTPEHGVGFQAPVLVQDRKREGW